MKNQVVKIGGGGIASLCSAINLRLAGFNVSVYEKNQDIGWHHHNDWEGLENWTNEEDVFEFLKRINIKIDFPYYPFYESIGLDSELNKYEVKSKVPLFYIIKRGPTLDSLDQSLKRQLQKLGVRFEFNRIIKSEEADIVGLGHKKKAYDVALGINFKTDLKNTAVCLLNDKIAPQAYAYLLVVNNQATLATCFITLKKDLKTGPQYLEKTIEQFQKFSKFSIQEPKYFAGCANIGFLKNKDKIYIGEATGFQDGLLGFGMRHAFLSDYLATQSILETDNYREANKIYWRKVEKEIYPLLKTSVVNKFIYEFFTNKTYKWLLEKMVNLSDIRKFIQKQYQPSFYKNFLFPIAKIRARNYLIR